MNTDDVWVIQYTQVTVMSFYYYRHVGGIGCYVSAVQRGELMNACKLLCVELYTSRNAWSVNNRGIRIFGFPRFNSLFIHVNEYTSNEAAWFYAH